jgi:hypothetical protein
MQSLQLRGYRGAVHTVGVTAQGILYLDIQKFGESRSEDASTYYVRASDVLTIKRLSSRGRRRLLTNLELVKLFAASFHTVEYALEWLRWAGIPSVRRYDAGAGLNAEDHIPQEVRS